MLIVTTSKQRRIAKISAKDRRALDKLRSLADSHKIKISRAFIEAVEAARAELPLDEIVELLRQGRTGAAQEAINAAVDRAGFGAYTSATRDAAVRGGEIAATLASAFRPRGLEVRFDVVNPGTAQFLRQYAMDQIRELTQETRRVVRQALIDGIEAGRNPLDTARDVRASIGLTRRQDAAVRNYRRQLQEGSLAALQRELRDRRFDSAVRRASEEPLSDEQVDKIVGRYRERYLKYRAETIARTESIRAVQAGQQELWRQSVQDGVFAESQVRRAWIYVHDNKVRDAHREIPELNPDGVGLEEPFETSLGPLLYPGDPSGAPENVIGCRCAVVVTYTPSLVE